MDRGRRPAAEVLTIGLDCTLLVEHEPRDGDPLCVDALHLKRDRRLFDALRALPALQRTRWPVPQGMASEQPETDVDHMGDPLKFCVAADLRLEAIEIPDLDVHPLHPWNRAVFALLAEVDWRCRVWFDWY